MNIRTFNENDINYLVKWLNNPIVLEFYEGRDTSLTFEEANIKYNNLDDIKHYILEIKDFPIGYLQFYQLTDLEYKEYDYNLNQVVYGIDLFIGEPDYWNKGYGTKLLQQFISLNQNANIDYIVVDPLVQNTRAIKCYNKVGFQKKKDLIKHELHEGIYRDALLLEYQMKK